VRDAYLELPEVLGDVQRRGLFDVGELDLLEDPLVAEQVLRVRPLPAFLRQRLAYEVLRLRRDAAPVLWLEGQLSRSDGLEHFLFSFASEGRPSAQQNVGDDAHAPGVDLFVVGLFLDDLGRHVEGAAQHLLQALARVVETGEPEVCDFDVEALGVLVL